MDIKGSTRGPRGPNKVKEKFQRGEGVIFNPKFILQILDFSISPTVGGCRLFPSLKKAPRKLMGREMKRRFKLQYRVTRG